ncbi:MAG: endonuclease/exonuclease/phosphatase family protein [Lentisphaeria bacterium]|nr:endonuclease/exonuclease/phosphatase family protein [Lentisphaeria bacterium]
MTVNHAIQICLIAALTCFFPSAMGGDPVPAATVRPVTVCSFNVENFLDPESDYQESKPPAKRETCLKALAEINADILALLEVGGPRAVEQIRTGLAKLGVDYPFHTRVQGADEIRQIVIFSKIKPKEIEHKTDAFYELRGVSVPIQRGFANCLFEWPNGYQLRLLVAHFKSKRFHKLGQSDMRRYESRHLRYLVNDMILNNPDCNLLVMGDFNDSPNSSPLNTLFSRRRNPEGQLFDLRPLDQHGFSWTHFWAAEDSYARIDYILTNQSVLPEIDFSGTKIVQTPAILAASDHRPVMVTLHPLDKPVTDQTLAPFQRNIRVPSTNTPVPE